MSVVLRRKEISDNDCLTMLLQNSTFKLAKTLGRNGITIELNCIENSPYFSLFFNNSTENIERRNIQEFIIKIVVIKIDSRRRNEPNIGFRYSNQDKYNNEILAQKLAFLQTFMIDCQMRGVSPDCICAFHVDFKNFEKFLNIFNIPQLTALGEIIKGNNNLKLGCIVMEKLDNVLENFGYEINTTIFSSNDEKIFKINDYFQMKSNSLICLDKLHYIGLKHNDVKPDNIIDGLLIDYGESESINVINSTSTRKRNFNDLDYNGGDVYETNIVNKKSGGRPTIDRENYIIKCIFGLENIFLNQYGECVGDYRLNQTTIELCDYYDFFEKAPYTLNQSKKKTIVNFKEKYAAINIMNEIDRNNVIMGRKIKDYLINRICGPSCDETAKKDLLEEMKQKDMSIIYRILGKRDANCGYLSLFNTFIEHSNDINTCYDILINQDAICSDIFISKEVAENDVPPSMGDEVPTSGIDIKDKELTPLGGKKRYIYKKIKTNKKRKKNKTNKKITSKRKKKKYK